MAQRRIRQPRLAATLVAVGLMIATVATGIPSASTAVAAPQPLTGINVPRTWAADLSDPVALTYLHGLVWFADRGTHADGDETTGSIGRITSQGYVENFPTTLLPTSLTIGPDHNLWFGMDNGEIGRMTAKGATKYFHVKTDAAIENITPGPGGLWFDGGGGAFNPTPFVGRISTTGKIAIRHSKYFFTPRALAAAGGSMWVIDTGGLNHNQHLIDPYVLNFTPGKPAVTRTRTADLVNGDAAITRGPDGALWIADGHVMRLSTTGHWSTYGSSTLQADGSIIVGPDKRLWFPASPSKVGAITTGGHLSYRVGSARSLSFGSGHSLWGSVLHGIEKMSTKSTARRTFQGGIADPTAIVTGPDKSLWFTNQGNDTIGRFAPGKGAVFYASSKVDQPTDLVVGPDKGIWFTNKGNDTIGRIGSATHKITAFHGTGIKAPWGITVGSDKALWFTNHGNNSIGRITTTGTVKNYPGGSDTQDPEGITTGPDGALWYASNYNNAIDRLDPNSHAVTSYSDGNNYIVEPTSVLSAGGYVWATSGSGSFAVLDRISPSGGMAHRTFGAEVEGINGLGKDNAGRVWFTAGGDTTGQFPNRGGIGVRATSTKIYFRNARSSAQSPDAITQGPTSAMWFVSGGYAQSISEVTPKN